MNNRINLQLLPLDVLIKTGPVDHADWNFRPILGWIQQLRFKMILKLLGPHSVHRLLEVGYGSGVLMPSLARHCQELYGIDVHAKHNEVAEVLKSFNVTANLYSGSAESMPFADDFFDGAIAVSSLEFINNMESASQELQRVIKPGGFLILVTPGHSPIVDLGLKVLTGKSAERDYDDRRQHLLPTLMKRFEVEQRMSFPPLGHFVLCLYTALQLSPLPKSKP